jgi:transitional endoplasmic reticulum ATPase
MSETGAGRENQISLRVLEAEPGDAGRGIARMDPDDMMRLAVDAGDIVSIAGAGRKEAAAKILPAHMEYRGRSGIQLDGIGRENAGAGIDDRVTVKKSPYNRARIITLSPADNIGGTDAEWDAGHISRLLEGLPVMEGNLVRLALFGTGTVNFTVARTSPKGVVLAHSDTALMIDPSAGAGEGGLCRIAYKDIGGLQAEIRRVREMIELPLLYPEVFERLGICPPSGLLLYGPPGTGKTLIARAIAAETDAHFIAVNGPEIIHKFYGESEARLREVFEEAAVKAPAVIFIDEIDAIAPKRAEVSGEVEKRVVGQLLVLMDGLKRRKQVAVIGATNIPDSIDPALRRPGRFDREISISVPNKEGRAEILGIHTRNMPLAGDVDLARLAEITHGFVGADLEALCREAGMTAIREALPEKDFRSRVSHERLLALEVGMGHFARALEEVEPSAIREAYVEIPNVNWEDIGGLKEIKAALREAIEWPLKYQELFSRVKAHQPKGIILAGPPGTGKTLIAKAAASTSNANFISVKGPAVFSKWVGESERLLREIFKKAKQASPCIIFFDEIDALSCGRSPGGSDSGVGQRVISQLLTEMDGVEELKGVVVLAATNRLELVDPALLRQGRFDHILQIPEPDERARCEIFKIHLKGRPVAGEVSPEELAARTGGFVGSDIYGACEKAAMKAIDKFLAGGGVSPEQLAIDADDMRRAIDEVARMKGLAEKYCDRA